MQLAITFPGQGSQAVNMLQGFADQPSIKATFAEASQVLGQDLWALITDDNAAEALNQTVNTQPVMLTAGVAIYRLWRALGGIAPVVMAGHSLGEYAALVAAEALSFADAVRLVRVRAQAMQDAVPAGAGAMAAVLGLEPNILAQVCDQAAQGEVLSMVNLNAPGQIVIAGTASAVARGIAAAKTSGAKRALLLPVSVPSHCALMQPAAEHLAQALADVTIQPPQIPVLQNADVTAYEDPEAIRAALVRQLYLPVCWIETVQAIAARGVSDIAECGAGKVLLGLNKRIATGVNHLAWTDSAALQASLHVA
jgi:[acyl-carrier-protein] S-malonyltransferase